MDPAIRSLQSWTAGWRSKIGDQQSAFQSKRYHSGFPQSHVRHSSSRIPHAFRLLGQPQMHPLRQECSPTCVTSPLYFSASDCRVVVVDPNPLVALQFQNYPTAYLARSMLCANRRSYSSDHRRLLRIGTRRRRKSRMNHLQWPRIEAAPPNLHSRKPGRYASWRSPGLTIEVRWTCGL